MIAVWIILGIVIYLTIGSILAGLYNDEDMEAPLISAWPLIVCGLAVYYLVQGIRFIGHMIANQIIKFVNYIKK